MMHYHWLPVLSILAATLGSLGTPLTTIWDDVLVKHTWNATPANWVSLGRPPAGTTTNIYIALKPKRENALIDALHEVSTPGHPKYGTYLSREQVADLVAPHPDTLDLIRSWLEHHGISSSSVSRSHGGGWLTVTNVPVSQADNLLGASYHLYRQTGTDETAVILRTVGYALPAALHAHVQAVAPTTHFDSPRLPRQRPRKRSRREGTKMERWMSEELVGVLKTCDDDFEVEPSLLRWLYKTVIYVPAAIEKNLLGVVGFKDSYPSQDDLKIFMENFRSDKPAATFTVVQINDGGNDPSNPGSEASTDIQYAGGMANPTPLIFYSTGGDGVMWSTGGPAPGDAYLEWLNYMVSVEKVPQTISFSYSSEELDLPAEYAKPLCRLFAQLGARGVSVLVASGDEGVGRGDCKDKSGRVQFNPTFPASCPYVTGVGGTTCSYPEVGADLSQGGFSLIFAPERYQVDALAPFLRQVRSDYSGFYNPKGRGVPDIAAQALNCVMYKKGDDRLVDGTSCSAPIMAGVISLLNDYQLSQGKPPLGFLNPWLYGQGRAGLNDIKSGSNPGCKTEGFDAIRGWDPVTGLGTPDFIKLQKILPVTQGVPAIDDQPGESSSA